MKSILILGLGRFGISVAKTLYSLGNEVMVVDKNAELVNDIAENVTHAVVGDMSDENVLRSIGAQNFDMVFIGASEDIGVSMMTAMVLKEVGAKYIIAKAQSEMHGKILTKIGVDKIVRPEHDMGVKIAHSLVRGDFIDFIELSPDYSIAEINVPEDWLGKTILELDIRKKYGINILAVKKDGVINAEPGADYVFSPNSLVVVMGSNKKLSKLK